MSVSVSQAVSATSAKCNHCGKAFATPAMAATCLCVRLRYITTLGIRLGQVPSLAQLQGITSRQHAAKVSAWQNSRLRAAQQASALAPVAPHQQAALAYLQLPVPGNAGAADQALIAWFKSTVATSKAVWALAQHLTAPQPVQLSLF